MVATQGLGLISNMSNGLVRVLGFAFRLRLLFFFMLFILINTIIISIQEKSLHPAIDDLGERFLTPTLKVQEMSLEAIDDGGLYHRSNNLWGGMIDYVLDMWGILTQFYIILMWISVIGMFLTFLMMDTSKKPIGYILAVPTFLFFQMALIAKTGKGDFFQPVSALKDFFRAIPYLLKPITSSGNSKNILNDSNLSLIENSNNYSLNPTAI